MLLIEKVGKLLDITGKIKTDLNANQYIGNEAKSGLEEIDRILFDIRQDISSITSSMNMVNEATLETNRLIKMLYGITFEGGGVNAR
jgi:archaellum component FlaC